MYRIMCSKGTQLTCISLIEIQRLYNRGEIAINDVLQKQNEKGWRVVGDALGESLLGSGSRARTRRSPFPIPPLVEWWFTLLIGCLTGGIGLGFIGLLQGIWSRRIQPRFLPVVWPLCAILLPPAHLLWAISLMLHEHPHLLSALLHIVVGFIAADLVGICFASMGSLSVRKTMLQKFGIGGFSMSFILTALLGPVYVAWKAEELKRINE